MIKYSEDYYEEEKVCHKCGKKAEVLVEGLCKECNDKKIVNLSEDDLKTKRKKAKNIMLVTVGIIVILSCFGGSSEMILSMNGMCGFALIIEIAYYVSLFPNIWSKLLLLKDRTKEPPKEYCSNCGEKINKSADICYKCGAAPKKVESPRFCRHCGNSITNEQVICLHCKNNIKRGQSAGWGETIISFLIPLIGFIIYATNVSTKKQYAKDCLTCSLIGVGLYILIVLCIYP